MTILLTGAASQLAQALRQLLEALARVQPRNN